MKNEAIAYYERVSAHQNGDADHGHSASLFDKVNRFFRLGHPSRTPDQPTAHTLLVLCVVQALLGFVALVVDMLGEGFIMPQHLLCVLAILIVSAIPAFVVRTGRIRLAAWIFNLTISLVVFLLCLLTAGILSASAPILMLPVIWAWSTLGSRGSLAVCALTALEILCLSWWSVSGHAPREMTELGGLPPAYGLGLILILVAFSGTVSGYVGYRNNQIHREHLIRARDEAQRANRAKAEFIASIAHEVRTPLTGLMGMLELLAREQLEKSHADMAGTARSSARNILNLINDLLDLSKIEVGELRLLPEPTDLTLLLNETVQEFQKQADEKGIQLELWITGEPAWVLVDPLRFRQIASNFLSNALKFTESGRVIVNMSTIDHGQSMIGVRLSVEDTGPGIPHSQQRKIFDRFTQIDNIQRAKYNGTGLGLAIVADLAKLLGGRVWVESEEAQGSEFFFEAEFKRTSPLELPDISVDRSAHADMTILITDDSLGNQRVLSRYLQSLGYSTRAVENGSDAVVAISGGNIDLVFLDFHMPVKDGPETLQDIRRLPDQKLANTPVIAMSADTTENDVKRWAEAGVDGIIAKPIDFPALDLTIRRVLDSQRKTDNDD